MQFVVHAVTIELVKNRTLEECVELAVQTHMGPYFVESPQADFAKALFLHGPCAV